MFTLTGSKEEEGAYICLNETSASAIKLVFVAFLLNTQH